MARPRRPSASSTTSSLPSSSHTTSAAPFGTSHELNSSYDYLCKIILLGPSGTGKSCLLHRFVKSEFRVLSSQTIGVEFSSKIVKIGSGAGRRRIKLQLWDTAGTERFRSVSRSYYRGAAGAILVYDVANKESFDALQTFLVDVRALAGKGVVVVLAGNKADLAEGESNTTTTNKSAERETGIGGDQQPPPTAGSSVSSRQSAFPFETGGNPSTPTLPPSSRDRTSSLTLPTSSKWTASTSPYGREIPPSAASLWASKNAIPSTIECSALTGENVDELFHRLARMILTKIELGEIDPDDPASGIQYGDMPSGAGGGGDGWSVKSGEEGGSIRRRKRGPGGRRKGLGLGVNLGEWGDVFKSPLGGGRGRCC